MLRRQNSGSVVCPNCGRLVGVRDDKCFHCGRTAPGLFGYAPALRQVADGVSFFDVVTAGCVLMYVVSIILRPSAAFEGRGLLTILSPGGPEIFLLGSSGGWPIFGYGRWWTVLSASWLHGGLLHIGFNLYWLRKMGGSVVEILGLGRTVLIYTAGSILGFLGTSLMSFVQIPLLSGASHTLGASAALCGLVGGLYAYGERSGNSFIKNYVKQFAISILIIGILIPMIDNWAHIFGFLGGYVAARVLRPLEDESPMHLVGALVCLVAFVAAIVASVIHGLPIYRQLLLTL